MDLCRSAMQLARGDRASLLHLFSEIDPPLFAAATGDVNPIHFNRAYAETTFFKGTIAHGMLCGGLISAVIGNRLPGIGTVYISQNLRFLAPVRVGDAVTAEVEVIHVDVERNRVSLRTTCTNQDGTVVVEGEAVVSPPKRVPPPELADGIRGASAMLEGRLEAGVAGFSERFNGAPRGGQDENSPFAA